MSNGRKPLTNKQFIEKARIIHGNKYDYSLVEYKKSLINVKIICSIHGIFHQKPCWHLRGTGCQKCDHSYFSNTETFIKKAKVFHGNTYDYSKVKYNGCKNKVKIICKHHGIFLQLPTIHIRGHGCKDCANTNNCRYKWKNYTLGNKTINVLGYEPQALDYMTKKLNIEPKNILNGKKVPVIRYSNKRRYYPDFYIKNENRLVEVKSTYTLLEGLNELKLKHIASIKAGFKHSILVMTGNGNRIRLPTNWLSLSKKEISRSLLK